MAELRPYPFGLLVRRMLREARAEAKVFDLPFAACFLGTRNEVDLSVGFHGLRAGTPLGPAAGPHSQMAQNLVLSWLAGCRVMELKTVQVLDQLEIPRPCIDMATVGFNVEWSQELRLAESLEEYVKGSMLIEILRHSGEVPASVARGAPLGDVIFDMSVGYDLAGIRTEAVQTFLRGMQDAGPLVDRLRAELLGDELRDVLADYPQLAEIDFRRQLSNTLTLSTFHGCPPGEIEGIAAHLMRANGLDVVVKLNPTLLGPERLKALLADQLGYGALVVPAKAFESDTRWDEMTAFVDRLGNLAQELGRSFGVKFTNTLIVENQRDFFPSTEKEMYLSGAPLHVLAMQLVAKFRQVFGGRFPISFSAGIDRANFADAVALGLVPVTVCTDLLRPGGYARAAKYFETLETRMAKVGARSIDDFVILAFGRGPEALMNAWVSSGAADFAALGASEAALQNGGDLRAAAGPVLYAAWVQEAALLNTVEYVPRATADPRYAAAQNARAPKKIGQHLDFFDCTACDKCVPVCPNDANFVFVLPALDLPIRILRREGSAFRIHEEGRLVIAKAKQYANFADFCNECGNCDVFCPEDGGPYKVKPRFFRTTADWERFADLDGFVLGEGGEVVGRITGQDYRLRTAEGQVFFRGPGFELSLDPELSLESVRGELDPEVRVDLTYLSILTWVRDAVFDSEQANYLNMQRPLR